jgi:hypothetical protein
MNHTVTSLQNIPKSSKWLNRDITSNRTAPITTRNSINQKSTIINRLLKWNHNNLLHLGISQKSTEKLGGIDTEWPNITNRKSSLISLEIASSDDHEWSGLPLGSMGHGSSSGFTIRLAENRALYSLHRSRVSLHLTLSVLSPISSLL